ncbi:MAG: DUF4136 domain-containing protein [Parabacteroides sp.]
MKKSSLLIAAWFVCLLVQAQTRKNMVCRLGFTYEISQNDNWGKGKPVVKSITPYTSAERSGLSAYDMIDEIDGVSTLELTPEEIEILLNPSDKSDVMLVVRNMSQSTKQVLIKKECKRANAISEEQLASAFQMYSLETTEDRLFVCPFKTTVTKDPVDFSAYHTFAFTLPDIGNEKLESAINDVIEKELKKKGLRVDADRPDIIVQTYYYYDKNPNYKGVNKLVVTREPVYRFNVNTSKMEEFPFLDASTAESEAEYILQFGIRLIDQREVLGRVLWECEANELMSDSYRLEEYVRIHTPLMCMQFPYVTYRNNVTFHACKKRYNYTGLQLDMDQLGNVVAVDRNSPAAEAGIRARDVIERVGKYKMGYSVDEFSAAYKQFIFDTMNYRDPSTLFTDANGFKYCMYWDTFKYTKVADAMQENRYLPAFTYLYAFMPFVNPSGNNSCTFTVKRGKTEMELVVRPVIRSEITLEIK